MSLRRLKAWEAAGLVDATTAARIREWESSHASPLAMRAVIGIAALAIGLGLLSVIAANWDAVPGVVRLGVHFALMVALAHRDAFLRCGVIRGAGRARRLGGGRPAGVRAA